MKQKEDLQIKHLLEDELSEQFINKRETLRNEAKENILRLQAENKKQYNKHRKPALITTNQFTCSPAPRTAWSSGCPCGYQLLADHFRSHDRTEVTRGSQSRWRDSPLPAAISTR
ncbi:hypothetical protein TNCV_662641 [Trichonephila clavipes]|nr:hypothetical protein TNCV_662641 [Trichonephila clavipes]